MQNSTKDFWIWLAWLIVTIGTVLLTLHYWYVSNQDKSLQNGYRDNTGITWIILAVFIVALLINIINTWFIKQEFSRLNRNRGLFQTHRDNLRVAAQSQLVIDQDFSLSIIENQLLRRESWVQLFAGLLVTLGMVGTVLGLTLAMGALSGSLENIQESLMSDGSGEGLNSVAGLGDALAGMSSAFITTLAGAVLGGLFLKLLSHSTTNLIEDLLDRMRHKAELEVIPELQHQAWNREMQKLSHSHQNLQAFIRSAGNIENTLYNYTQSMSRAASNMDGLARYLDQQLLTYTDTTAQGLIIKRIEQSLKNLGATTKSLYISISVFMVALSIVVGICAVIFFLGRN